jgi:hypothetical protein
LLDRLDADLVRADDETLDAARLHALLTNVVDTTHAIAASISEELFGATVVPKSSSPAGPQSQSQSSGGSQSQRQSQHSGPQG